MAMKWLILYSRRRNEKSMAQRLASECLAAAKEETAVKKMDTLTRWQKLTKHSLTLDFNS
jgi:ribosomal protein S7